LTGGKELGRLRLVDILALHHAAVLLHRRPGQPGSPQPRGDL